MKLRNNLLARSTIRSLRRVGTWIIPAGAPKLYQFTQAKKYWQNVPRGWGGTFNTQELQNISDEVLIKEFNQERKMARSKSPERQIGFVKAMESIFKITHPKVLDYGSGMGFYGFEILDQSSKAHVTFADINEDNLKAIERIAKMKGCYDRILTVLISDEKAQDFYIGSKLDLILAMGVLHHTPHAKDIVHHISSFLKTGAIFQAMLYNTDFLRASEQGRGRRLNTTDFAKITDLDAEGLSNPYSEAYDLEKTKQLFEGLEFLSLDHPTPYYSIYCFKKIL